MVSLGNYSPNTHLGKCWLVALGQLVLTLVLEINPFRLLTIYLSFPLDGKRDYD